MDGRRQHLNFKGISVMEYVIVIGLVSLLLTGMNIYIKRGMQAKLKDMTDYFITSEQETDINPSMRTESQADTEYGSELDTQLFVGGGTRTSLLETTDTEASSYSTDSDTPYTDTPFIPAPTGFIDPPTIDMPTGE